MDPDQFMLHAIELSRENVRANRGGPFAAVVVRNGEVLAEGANLVTSANDPTAHAEIVAIRRACAKLGCFQLPGCDIYATCEPCPMCLGAIYWARPSRLFYANLRDDASAIGFDDSFIYGEIARPFEERALPMIPLLREKALEVFDEWRRKADKTRY